HAIPGEVRAREEGLHAERRLGEEGDLPEIVQRGRAEVEQYVEGPLDDRREDPALEQEDSDARGSRVVVRIVDVGARAERDLSARVQGGIAEAEDAGERPFLARGDGEEVTVSQKEPAEARVEHPQKGDLAQVVQRGVPDEVFERVGLVEQGGDRTSGA